MPDVRRAGRRARGAHGGGAGRRRADAAPAAARVPRRARAPVRVLHRRLPHEPRAVRPRPARRIRGGDPRGAGRQPVPLHGLRADRRRGPAGRGRAPGRRRVTAVGPYAEPYPRFSDEEMARRRAAVLEVLREHEADHLVAYGANRFGSAVGWLTRWPVTREAFVVVTPGEQDTLFVDFYNHVPNARRIATEAEVGPLEARGIEHPLAELRRRGAAARRVGVIGPLGWRDHARLAELAGEVVALDADYTRLRLRKSAEELDWLRVGCALSDRAVRGLGAGARPGLDERELGDLVEREYLARGGTTHIHYFATTRMDRPGVAVPAQWPSARRLCAGDALVCEISASFWEHPGQVLRTFAVEAEPTPLYRELHEVADAAFDAVVARLRAGATATELVDASGLIEDAGFTTRDDLVHGFVGGYLPPVLGTRSRALAGARLHLRGGDDGGRPAQRRHARRAGRRADGRAGPGDAGRRAVAARRRARSAAGRRGRAGAVGADAGPAATPTRDALGYGMSHLPQPATTARAHRAGAKAASARRPACADTAVGVTGRTPAPRTGGDARPIPPGRRRHRRPGVRSRAASRPALRGPGPCCGPTSPRARAPARRRPCRAACRRPAGPRRGSA